MDSVICCYQKFIIHLPNWIILTTETPGNKLYGKFEFQYDVLKNLKLTTRFWLYEI